MRKSVTPFIVVGMLLVSLCLQGEALAAPGETVRLSGTVVRGNRPAPGAEVSAQAWPNWRFLNLVPAEQAFDLIPLGVALADDDGNFAMDVNVSNLPATYLTDEGHVEIEVSAVYMGSVAEFFTTEPEANVTASFVIPPIDVGRVEANLASLQTSSVEAATCSPHWVSGSENGPYQTKIMDVMALGQVTGTGTYSYGGSTSTTLGILAQSPISGNWSASGTSTIGTSSSTGFQASSIKDKRLFAQFKYRKYIDGYCQTLNKPYNFYGRGNTNSIGHSNYSNCGGTYRVGDLYTHSSTSNQTYSNGLTVFSIGLSSRAGYTSTASLKFKFNARGNVCGNNSSLGESSPIVEASTQ